MEHVFKYRPQTDNYRYEKVVKIEKQYDYLSIIRPHETPQQWANRVIGPLQELLSKQEYSVYHVFCLFASFGEGITKAYYSHVNGELIDIPYEYRRPRVHKSEMAICFKCWKLVKITEVKPKKVYFNGYRRWGYEVESEDLMKNHWNYSCFATKTEEAPLELDKSYSLTSPKETTSSMQCSISAPSIINTNRPGEGNTNKLFISSLFAKQINLLPSHLNLPKDTVLRLKDGTEITIV